jgi:hemoglobin
MKRHQIVIGVLLSQVCFGVALGAWGCGGKSPPKPITPTIIEDAGPPPPPPEDAAPKALFDRLGGKDGISAIVDSLLKNIAGDPELKKVFAKTTGARLEAFKKNLADQLCEATGGPCQYKGKDMKAAHAGLKVTESQWDKFVLMLTAALNEHKVADDEQSELWAILGPMKDQIVAAKKK